MPYYIYILRCADDTLYTGITTDLTKRMRQHCGCIKGGAKYTRSHPPKAVVCVWKTDGHGTAARFEYAYKHLCRQKKLELIAAPECWHTVMPQLEKSVYEPFAAKTLEAYTNNTA